MPKRPVSVKRLQTMEKKLRGNSIADLRKVGQCIEPRIKPAGKDDRPHTFQHIYQEHH